MTKLYRSLWNRMFSLDRLLANLTRLMARLETLSALRRSEIEAVHTTIKNLEALSRSKSEEADRADRIRSRFEALVR